MPQPSGITDYEANATTALKQRSHDLAAHKTCRTSKRDRHMNYDSSLEMSLCKGGDSYLKIYQQIDAHNQF